MLYSNLETIRNLTMQISQGDHSKCPKLHKLQLCRDNHERCNSYGYWKRRAQRSGLILSEEFIIKDKDMQQLHRHWNRSIESTYPLILCDKCQKDISQFQETMTCGQCKYDLCRNCSQFNHCPRQHHRQTRCQSDKERKLCYEMQRDIFFCNGCIKKVTPKQPTMTCGNCSYDLCMNCYT